MKTLSGISTRQERESGVRLNCNFFDTTTKSWSPSEEKVVLTPQGLAKDQGDQIGRIFAQRAINYLHTLGSSLKVTEIVKIFRATFSTKIFISGTKMGRATFWAIFRKLIWSPCTRI
jgi:hypothetical protein